MKQSKIQDLLIEFVKKVNTLSPNNPVGNVMNLNLISHDYSRKFKLILDDLQNTTISQTRKACYGEMREMVDQLDTNLEVKLNDGSEGTDYQEGWDDACLEWDLLLNTELKELNQMLKEKEGE